MASPFFNLDGDEEKWKYVDSNPGKISTDIDIRTFRSQYKRSEKLIDSFKEARGEMINKSIY